MSAEPSPNTTAGALVGASVGVLLVGLGLAHPSGDVFRILPDRGLAIAVLAHSAGVALSLGTLVGALAGRLLGGLSDRPAGGLLAGLGAGSVVLLERTATRQLEDLSGLALGHPARLSGALRDGLLALGVTVALALLLRRWSPARGLRSAARGLLVLGLLLALAPLPRLLPRSVEPVPGPSKIVVVGLDGFTFRVLSPLVRQGAAPTFRRLLREGAAATLVTWGAASSPRVWTSLATGKTTADHGVEDFLAPPRPGTYRSRVVRSGDRRVPAFWEILDSVGRPVLVVNWLVSVPVDALEHGAMVGDVLGPPSSSAVHPRRLGPPVRRFLADHPGSGFAPDPKATERIFGLTQAILDRHGAAAPPPSHGPEADAGRLRAFDLVAVYDPAPDGAEHASWRLHEPEAFPEDRWPPLRSPDGSGHPGGGADPVARAYRLADASLGRLLDRLDSSRDLLLVVSDHGQRAANAPTVHLRLDRLLESLGWAELDAGGRADPSRSRAWALDHTAWNPEGRIRLNLRGREELGTIPPGSAARARARLRAELVEVRFADGSPFFARVEERTGVAPTADLAVEPTPAALRPTSAGRPVRVGSTDVPWEDLVRVDASLTGQHDRQALLLAWGRGVRPGWHGPRMVSTSLQRILRHLAEKVAGAGAAIHLLGRWGWIDPGTTLDLTPTLLWALDVPVGRDMSGRPWRWLLELEHPVREVDSWDALRRPRDAPPEPEVDEELLRELRALGYVD